MPIYEFRCKECDEVTEFITAVSNNTETFTCSKCGSKDLEKLLSITNISSYPSPKGGKTCCGRDERCSTPPCGTSCCSH